MNMKSVDLVAGTRCSFAPPAQTLELDPAVFSNLRVDVHLAEEGDDLVLSLAASADAVLVCDRTLDMYTTRVSGSCRILLLPSGGAETDHAYDEVISVDPLQRVVDVTDVARDTVMLAVPMRKVTPHATDLVLPRVFGAPKSAVAQHWAPLQHLHSGS